MEQGIEFARQAMPHVILEGGFSPKDVFNMDETCLFLRLNFQRHFLQVHHCVNNQFFTCIIQDIYFFVSSFTWHVVYYR